MNTPLSLLQKYYLKISKLDHALTFLHWDHMVIMPPGGNQARAEAIAELTALRHEMLTTREIGDLLEEAARAADAPVTTRNVHEMKRLYQRAVCLPTDLVKAKSRAGTLCEHEWRRQRTNNDWSGFKANFQEVVRLAREEAQARFDYTPQLFASPYDTMLDLYCTGDSSQFITEVVASLKRELPPLVHEIVEKQQGEKVVNLHGHYPADQQRLLNRELMICLGFDFHRGRLDVSAHPFSTGCRGDQRITTRFRDNDFLDALLATAHETGHASYEDNLPAQWDGLPIGLARSMSLHEGQSLLFEKQLFLSPAFINFFITLLHRFLPSTAGLNGSELWRAATRVQPSLIRVEADEVTYPLHVILRYEIERDLVNGILSVADVPEMWNEKMNEYLGLSTVGNYRDGCLQDMHWSDGTFGYFPSYTLGAINSAQLFATIRTAHPDCYSRLAAGDVTFIRRWLEHAVWKKGSSMDGQDIMMEATGEGTNPQYLLNHFRDRYLRGLA